MFRPVLAACLVVVLAPLASAVIIFAPVQYQYRDPVNNAPPFYYGGSNPLVFEQGEIQQQRYNMSPGTGQIRTDFSQEGRFGYNLVPAGIITLPPAVTYTDLLPPGVNAYLYGFAVEDARNTAYANVPRYFRKRDLLASAYQIPDGTIVVPPAAPLPGTIEIEPYHPPTTTHPVSQPTSGPILIIPKRLLNKPLQPKAQIVVLAK